MILKFSILVIISTLMSPLVTCQYNLSELLVGILKILKKDKFCDIGIFYGSRYLSNYAADNDWRMVSIIKEASSLMILLKINRISLLNEVQADVQIILLDSLNLEEESKMYEKFRDTHSKLIFLTNNNTPDILVQMKPKNAAIVGRTTARNVTFSRLPLVSDQKEKNESPNWCLDEEFQGTLFPKEWILQTFQFQRLTVLIRNDPPFVFVKSYPNGSLHTEGYLIDLWNCITERLNLSFEFKFQSKEDGDFWNFDNNGFRVEMERWKVDVGLYASADPVDVYHNYTGVNTGVHLRLYMYEKKNRINYYQFINTVNPSCIEVLLLIGALSLFLLYIAGNNLVDCTFYFLAISFNQGHGEMLPTTYSIRIGIISFSISILVFFYVTSALMTGLSVSDKDSVSTKLEQLSDSNDIPRSCLVDYTSAHAMMRYSDLITTFDKLRKVKNITLPTVSHALTATSEFRLFSFIERERVWPYWEEFKCFVSESDLQKVRPTMFLVRRNLPNIQIFRQESIRLVENGVVSRLTKKWWPIIDTRRKEFVSISIADVADIVDLYLFGAMVSVLIFFIERNFGTT